MRRTKSLPWRARTKSTLRVDDICGDAADDILPLVGLKYTYAL